MDSEGITAEHWILTPEEQNIVMGKNRAQRLPFALLLLLYRVHRRFPTEMTEVDPTIVAQVARQLRVPITPHDGAVRTVERHRAEIRALAGFREATVDDAKMLTAWLSKQASIADSAHERLAELLEAHCREFFIEPPSRDRLDRIVRDAINDHEERFCAEVAAQLSPVARARLEALLYPEEESEDATPDIQDTAPALLLRLRSDPGRPCVATLEEQLARLRFIRDIPLPRDLFDAALPQDLEVYRRRVAVEAPYELRRHSEPIRLTMLAAFVYLRARTLTDDLTESLIETIHRIHARAERKVDRQILEEIKRVRGKQSLLFDIAGAVLDQPDGVVRDVVFPVAGEQTLQDLVKEGKATSEYRTTLRTVTRNSYKGHYRRMVPEILHVLEFRSNNEHHRPVIEAIELVKRYAKVTGLRTFPADEHVPIDGIVSGLWREAVMEPSVSGRAPRINRITYEICVLQALREKLRCKEIWVAGAHRYRNPDEDLPADFEAQRIPYYKALKLPLNADRFIADLQTEMREALHTLDRGMPRNPFVSFSNKAGGWITVTGLEPQPEPPNLSTLKAELSSTWPMTSLLDMVKETDLRLRFTDVLKSPAAFETLDRPEIQTRLLLCLHGLGTNAGLQRMAGRQSGITYKDLAYIRKRYISTEGLRQAIGIVANGTLRARNPAIWGEGTTACASDSKHFGAWDQNLTTQWHARYGGRGIMIYWHVEKKSLCIYSQLKSPASSEVASMIEGVIRHGTEMEVDRQYVDSHGQNTVAFGFCRLLGFHLMPRLKAIHAQKLYRPDIGQPGAYPNLAPVLTKAIDWDLIRQQYDQLVKYVTALRLGTADAESILRRFTRNNIQHPTYRAFAELGKAVKTIFLCRYLHSEELRREIQEGLNVIEQWNGATDFVFFARRGELASNRHEDHEASMLCLHLVQNCMVYVNTLMLQELLAQPKWTGKLSDRDLNALTPLVWEHVNPYGRFELDMNARLPLLP